MSNITVFVKGFKGQSRPVYIRENATVAELFEEISKTVKLEALSFRINFESHCLNLKDDGNKPLPEFGIRDKCTLFMVARLQGGR